MKTECKRKFEFYNPHPDGKILNDCVKRAITKVTGKDYREVQLTLNRYRKETGTKRFNDNKNWKTYVEKELGGIKLSFPAIQDAPRMNGKRFCEEFNNGTYLLRMAKHVVACINGTIYDTWDCSDKCVYVAWKIPHIREAAQ